MTKIILEIHLHSLTHNLIYLDQLSFLGKTCTSSFFLFFSNFVKHCMTCFVQLFLVFSSIMFVSDLVVHLIQIFCAFYFKLSSSAIYCFDSQFIYVPQYFCFDNDTTLDLIKIAFSPFRFTTYIYIYMYAIK